MPKRADILLSSWRPLFTRHIDIWVPASLGEFDRCQGDGPENYGEKKQSTGTRMLHPESERLGTNAPKAPGCQEHSLRSVTRLNAIATN